MLQGGDRRVEGKEICSESWLCLMKGLSYKKLARETTERECAVCGVRPTLEAHAPTGRSSDTTFEERVTFRTQ